MKKQISELQDRVSQGKLAADVVNMLKESQEKLVEANSVLLENIKFLKQAQQEKDALWELELEDIQKAMSSIKSTQNI